MAKWSIFPIYILYLYRVAWAYITMQPSWKFRGNFSHLQIQGKGISIEGNISVVRDNALALSRSWLAPAIFLWFVENNFLIQENDFSWVFVGFELQPIFARQLQLWSKIRLFNVSHTAF